MGLVRWTFALAFSCVAVVIPRPAAACEPGVCVFAHWPQDGADMVAVDGDLWLFYDVVGDHVPSARLYDASGAEVDTVAEVQQGGEIELASDAVLHLAPVQPLEPEATYRIAWDVPSSVCTALDQTTFTTAGSASPVVLDSPEVVSVSAAFVSGADPVGSCDLGPDRVRYGVAVRPAGDEVIYELLREGSVVDASLEPSLLYDVEGTPSLSAACFTVRLRGVNGDVGPETVACFESRSADPAPAHDSESLGCSTASATGYWSVALAVSAVFANRYRRWSVVGSRRMPTRRRSRSTSSR